MNDKIRTPSIESFKGIIIASHWNQQGQPTQLCLNTAGEKSYPILMDEEGIALLLYSSSIVQLWAQRIWKNQQTYLKVSEYKIIKC